MEAILKEGLAQLGLDTGSIPALTEFSRRLLEKNQVMNLTAITEPADVARLHLLDCACLLTAADFRGKQVVDVGTGAGFPGMPLRLLEPDFDLTLLDSLGKRVEWLTELCRELDLPDVVLLKGRAEELSRRKTHREQYDVAVSRALAAMPMLAELCLQIDAAAQARGRAAAISVNWPQAVLQVRFVDAAQPVETESLEDI